jgi:hypothetical protein
MYKLFLDDVRYPSSVGYNNKEWVIVRDYYSFIYHIKKNGVPCEISFDHDLGYYSNNKEKTGYDALKWLCDYLLENNKKLPKIHFHTSNSVGYDNMVSYLSNFIKHNPELK